MSHSTHVGFNAPLVGDTTIERLSCFPSRCRRWIEAIDRLPRSRLSSACGVGHIRAAIPSGIPPCAYLVEWSPVVGVGQYPSEFGPTGSDDPDPVTEVRGTNGRRGNALPLRVIPELGQVSEYGVHSASHKEAWDVFHEDEAGS